jgi:hypothetical protein
MRKTIWALFLTFLAVRPVVAAEPTFASHWQDGKAELDGYRYEVTRYGERRTGEAVMIFVTEPWSESERVKVDDPARNPALTFEALKLNLVRDFVTGIYDYNTMVSVFTRSADFSPVKISLSSAEWCGHVYNEVRFDPEGLRDDLWSYFQGESGTRTLEARKGAVSEDQLFIAIRGLRGEFLKPGEKRSVPFLPGLLQLRLTHRPMEWTTALIERKRADETVEVPAGRFPAAVYTVRTEGGREGRFWVETAHPHRIVKWTWSLPGAAGRAGDSSESGELAGTLREAYWKLNGPGNERYREQLGLRATAR